jgi:hypothetical protein
MAQKVRVYLADNNYGDMLNKTLDLISGKQKINIPVRVDTSQIELPKVKVEPTPATMKLVKTATYVLGGALGLLAISILTKKNR